MWTSLYQSVHFFYFYLLCRRYFSWCWSIIMLFFVITFSLLTRKFKKKKNKPNKIFLTNHFKFTQSTVLCYESRIAFSVLKVNCYQWESCVGGPSAFNSPFGHRNRSHNICPLDNHLSGLSISLSSLVLSWVYRWPFFKSLVWLGCDSNSQPSVLVASTLPLHYKSVVDIWVNYSYIAQ